MFLKLWYWLISFPFIIPFFLLSWRNGISLEDEILFYIIIILQETFCWISSEHWFWKAVHKWESWNVQSFKTCCCVSKQWHFKTNMCPVLLLLPLYQVNIMQNLYIVSSMVLFVVITSTSLARYCPKSSNVHFKYCFQEIQK